METTNKSFFAGDEERVAFAAPPTNTRLSYTLSQSVIHSFVHSFTVIDICTVYERHLISITQSTKKLPLSLHDYN